MQLPPLLQMLRAFPNLDEGVLLLKYTFITSFSSLGTLFSRLLQDKTHTSQAAIQGSPRSIRPKLLTVAISIQKQRKQTTIVFLGWASHLVSPVNCIRDGRHIFQFLINYNSEVRIYLKIVSIKIAHADQVQILKYFWSSKEQQLHEQMYLELSLKEMVGF